MKTLNDFNVGDKVRMWCIGWGAWDTHIVTIVKKGIFITIQYEGGRKSEFSQDTKAIFIN